MESNFEPLIAELEAKIDSVTDRAMRVESELRANGASDRTIHTMTEELMRLIGMHMAHYAMLARVHAIRSARHA